MGKRNRNNGERKPQIYRGKNVDMMGDPGRMEKHAIDVFRDMSNGRYNPNNIYEFLNRDFIISAINGAQKQLRRHEILFNALSFAYGASNDVDVIAMTRQEFNSCTGWRHVISVLYTVLNTQDLGTVYGLINQLSSSRDIRL